MSWNRPPICWTRISRPKNMNKLRMHWPKSVRNWCRPISLTMMQLNNSIRKITPQPLLRNSKRTRRLMKPRPKKTLSTRLRARFKMPLWQRRRPAKLSRSHKAKNPMTPLRQLQRKRSRMRAMKSRKPSGGHKKRKMKHVEMRWQLNLVNSIELSMHWNGRPLKPEKMRM